MIRRQRISQDQQRRGAAAVEFAVMAPLFMTLVLGTVEMGRALDVATNLSAALREGGRLASQDAKHHAIGSGMTANQKVIADIQNMLTAGGINGALTTVTITHADGPDVGTTFDLSNPDNYLKHFKIEASIAYNNVSVFPLRTLEASTLKSHIVFRLGKSELTQ